ncbi:GH25 family lysozyme, partial [Leuconostoc lactis]
GTAPGGGTAYLPPIAPSDFIDVSSHQSWLTQADYKAMYAAGIKTAVIKLSEYTTYKNPFAATQISYARNAGMKIAAYHYAWFTNPSEAANEAKYFANYAKALGLPSDTLMVDDYEEGYAVNSAGDKVADLNAFRNTLAQQGYPNVINYSYKAITGLDNIVDTNRISTKDIWMAQYPNEANPAAARALQYNSEFAAWQYSASKYFTGLSQNKPLDISIDYTGRFTN